MKLSMTSWERPALEAAGLRVRVWGKGKEALTFESDGSLTVTHYIDYSKDKRTTACPAPGSERIDLNLLTRGLKLQPGFRLSRIAMTNGPTDGHFTGRYAGAWQAVDEALSYRIDWGVWRMRRATDYFPGFEPFDITGVKFGKHTVMPGDAYAVCGSEFTLTFFVTGPARPLAALNRRISMRRIIIAAVIVGVGTAAVAQIPKNRPNPRPTANVFVPNTTQDAGSYTPPPKPADDVPKGVWIVSWDRKSWITSIDGKRSGFTYSLGSEHVIRGGNLGGFVAGRISSERIPSGNKYEPVGSMLTLVRESPTELVVRVSQISSGKLPWSASETRQGPLRLKIRFAGGARNIELLHDRKTHYRCSAGEPNCAP